jgi:hypothetical protein
MQKMKYRVPLLQLRPLRISARVVLQAQGATFAELGIEMLILSTNEPTTAEIKYIQ